MLSPVMVQGIADAFDEAEAALAIRAVVLAARGPVFCAGAELSVLEAAAHGDFSGWRTSTAGSCGSPPARCR